MSNNKEIQALFAHSVLAGDMATVTSLCDPDLVLVQGNATPYAGTYRGIEGFFEFLGKFGETLEISRLDTVRVYSADDPDWLVCEFIIEGTVKATGAPYSTTLLESWHFRDGRVASITPHYFNVP